jgi:hypothetical protein
MPLVPHYPGDEPEPREKPDIRGIVDRILDGDEDSVPAPGAR